MAQVLQKIAPFSLKPVNCRQAIKNWTNEDLVDLVKKVLKTEMDLDFLLELNPGDFKTLVACIRARLEGVPES